LLQNKKRKEKKSRAGDVAQCTEQGLEFDFLAPEKKSKRRLKSRILTASNVGEHVELQELQYTASGAAKRGSCIGRQLLGVLQS
jgi:hypothetical protein